MPLVGISQEVLDYEKLRVILPRVRVKAAFEWEERAQSQAVHLGGGVVPELSPVCGPLESLGWRQESALGWVCALRGFRVNCVRKNGSLTPHLTDKKKLISQASFWNVLIGTTPGGWGHSILIHSNKT